jgi:TonB family protein
MRILERIRSVNFLRIAVMELALGGLLLAQNPPDKPSGQPDDQSQDTVYQSGAKGVKNPRLIHNVFPEYSDKARRAKLEGTVFLTLVVDSSGNPTMIKVTQGLGSGLDEKAIAAVRQWKFEPGTKDGKPVAVQLAAEVSFHMYN